MLTRQEKERLVLDLYNQGKTIHEISQEVRMSFRDIGAILKKASGEMEEKQSLLSPSTQAYRLFSKGKAPIEVAIALNLSGSETTMFYEDYINLKQMHELRMVYEEIGDDIVHKKLRFDGLHISDNIDLSDSITDNKNFYEYLESKLQKRKLPILCNSSEEFRSKLIVIDEMFDPFEVDFILNISCHNTGSP